MTFLGVQLCIIFVTLAEVELNEVVLAKCCLRGMQLDIYQKSCIETPGLQVSFPKVMKLYPPIEENDYNRWIPPIFRTKLVVAFYYSDFIPLKIDEILEKDLKFHNTTINGALVESKSVCYDTIEGSGFRQINLTKIKLRTINKCCSKKRDMDKLSFCEEGPEQRVEDNDVDTELIGMSKILRWLPENISYQYLKVGYNKLREINGPKHFFEDDNLHWEVLSMPPSTRTTIRFWAHDRNGRNITDVTNSFCFDKFSHGSRVLLVSITNQRIISKCCPEGLLFDLESESCVFKEVKNNSNDIFPSTADKFKANWIPPEFLQLGKIEKHYNFSISDHYDIIIYEQSLKIFGTRNYKGLIHSGLIQSDDVCFDTIKSILTLRVIVRRFKLKPIPKCCPERERLSSNADMCVKSRKKDDEADLFDAEPPVIDSWFPSELSRYLFIAKYHTLQNIPRSIFNILIPINSDFTMKVVPSKSRDMAIFFSGYNASGTYILEGTDLFCFDAVEHDPLFPKVLLAAKYKATKCCFEHYQLNSFDNLCVPNNQETENNGNFNRGKETNKSVWLQTSIHNESLFTFYGIQRHMLTDIDEKVMASSASVKKKLASYTSAIPYIALDVTTLDGRPNKLFTDAFCIDNLEPVGSVVIFGHPSIAFIVKKCCYPGEILSPIGICEKHEGEDWIPGISEFRNIFDQSNPRDLVGLPLKFIVNVHQFKINSQISSRSKRYLKGERNDTEKYSRTYYCMDFQRQENGSLREVVGSVTFPYYAVTYQSVRPLGAAAAALLVAAAVVAVAREETRRTAHGRSLAAHALCLAAASVIQVTAFFKFPVPASECPNYAYSAYFFMMSSNWWLTSITFNMFLNFRKPLGALAPARGAGGGSRAVWRRFGAMSLAAWGGSAALTALAVVMHRNSHLATPSNGIIVPTFFETRTCKTEDTRLEGGGEGKVLNNYLGSIFYYYIPTTLLTVANAIFVVVTALGVRNLRRGTSILRRDATSETTGCFQKRHVQRVLFYTKLLLTTGFLELILETTMWPVGRQGGSGDFTLLKKNYYLFPILATGLEVIRAVSVFWLSTGREFGVGVALRFARVWFTSAKDWLWGKIRAFWRRINRINQDETGNAVTEMCDLGSK